MVVSLWRGKSDRREEKRRDLAPVAAAPVTVTEAAPKRDKQLNLKVSEDCKRVFGETRQSARVVGGGAVRGHGCRTRRNARQGRAVGGVMGNVVFLDGFGEKSAGPPHPRRHRSGDSLPAERRRSGVAGQ